MMTLPQSVKMVDVGPRDGLQNENQPVPTATKIELINRLADAGVPTVEATSFVSPKWIPQLADAEEVLAGIDRKVGTAFPVLVPNMKGMERALAAGVHEIAVFTAASEAFNRKNINCSIAESIERFRPVMESAREHGIRVRGYVSCVLGCPYEGEIEPKAVAEVARALGQLGCYEVSLGDTIGAGTPLAAQRMLEAVAGELPMERLAVHFHDTRGQALANILACLELGVSVVDASVGGLGGCPYADGASGNVATEDVVYMLHGAGVETGIDLEALLDTAHFISEALGREPASKLGRIRRDRALAWSRAQRGEV
jgi:isopropylmalate/homocitrate/citramalate synthase